MKDINKYIKQKNIMVLAAGFRCYTGMLKKRAGIINKSLPFDTGFFSPTSVVNVLTQPDIKLTPDMFTPCEKIGDRGPRAVRISFNRTTYDHVDRHFEQFKTNKISVNHMIDTQGGYYMLCEPYQVVLAHWVRAGQQKIERESSLKQQCTMYNRRIDRMMNSIDQSDHVIVFYFKTHKNRMDINGQSIDLTDFSSAENTLRKLHPRVTIVLLDGIDGDDAKVETMRRSVFNIQ